MDLLKEYASDKMKETLLKIPIGVYKAEEKLDDGALLKVSITIHGDTCTIDFTGTGSVHPGNMNATKAIVSSVVIYVMRLLIDEELPLNDGILEPVEIIIPTGMLNPDFSDEAEKCPAIVGGNVVIVLASEKKPLTAISFAEVLNSSDVPGGVVNILTGKQHELISHMASHMDVNTIIYCGKEENTIKTINELASNNVKRTIFYKKTNWNN